nr:TIR domain-containing protein [Leptospira weilii]
MTPNEIMIKSILQNLENNQNDLAAALTAFKSVSVQAEVQKLKDAVQIVSAAWSDSWLGYQSTVYIRDFEPKTIGDFFDPECGLMAIFGSRTTNRWVAYEFKDVMNFIWRMAATDREVIEAAVARNEQTFSDVRDSVESTLDVLTDNHDSSTLQEFKTKLHEIKNKLPVLQSIQALRPNQFRSRDDRALKEGPQTPPHIQVQAFIVEWSSTATALTELSKLCKRVISYVSLRQGDNNMTTSSGDRIFIGHGGSRVWKDLKDFLQDRLRLKWEEFSREPAAGISTKERLEQMLNSATFAFIVMTAEDEQPDSSVQARQNVVHEAGLFQGRLGFHRAIILLEEGCVEFSNIVGLTQIRFPKGDISARFEEIRRVLEREGIQ